jgi:hypothetical protein
VQRSFYYRCVATAELPHDAVSVLGLDIADAELNIDSGTLAKTITGNT